MLKLAQDRGSIAVRLIRCRYVYFRIAEAFRLVNHNAGEKLSEPNFAASPGSVPATPC
jgi:hypothetical protein